MIHQHQTSSWGGVWGRAEWLYLCPGDVLQLEELFHQDLVDLHQNHVHSVSVDQRQVSVTLEHPHTHTHTRHSAVTLVSHPDLEEASPSGPGLAR